MNSSQTHITIGQQLTLADLPGFIAKRFEIPPGHVGLVVDGKGQARTLPPGQHKVIGFWRRLLGRVSDWQFAILPSGPFPLRVPVPRLRAGDGGWIDVEVLAMLRVSDPARAAATLAMTIDLAAALSAGMEGPARQAVSGWAAGDVNRPEIAGRLASLLRPALEAQVEGLGLALEQVVAVTACPSDEAVAVAQKMADIEAALAQVEMEKKMSQLGTEAEWRDFARQLEADYELPKDTLQGAMPAAPEIEDAPATPGSNAARLRQTARGYAASRKAAVAVRLERLLGKRKPKRKPAKPPFLHWWERIVPWFKALGMILMLVGLAAFAFQPGGDPMNRFGSFVSLLCTLPEAVMLLAAAFWMERQAAIKRQEANPATPRLERLGRGDRQQMDTLVREQVARELRALADKLQDARNRAYREGWREEAMQLKDIETRADRFRQAVEAQSYGPAAYLTQARVSHKELATMLDYDEELLAQMAALNDQAESLRQAVLAGDSALAKELARQTESGLSVLDHQSQARSRFIQTPVRTTDEEE